MNNRPFEEIAEKYDGWYESNEGIFHLERRAIEAMEMKGMGLDVGAGTGILTQYSGASIGLDPSSSMLKRAQERGIQPVRGKGECLPFRDESFDFVVMSTSLCFVDSVHAVLDEIHRVLRARGLVGICIIPGDSAWGQHYQEKERRGHVVYKYAHFLGVDELKDLLTESKFEVLEILSTLHGDPGSKSSVHRDDEIVRGEPEGSYVCLKARKCEN